MNYINGSPWLDISLKMSGDFDELVLKLAEKIDSSAGGSGRSDAIRNIANSLSVVVANLLRNYFISPDLNLTVDLSNDGYPKGDFNPYRINIASIRKTINYLRVNESPMIDSCGGNYDTVNKKGHSTQIKYTDRFIILIARAGIKSGLFRDSNIEDISPTDLTIPIIRKTFDYGCYLRNFDRIFSQASLPSIRLRDGSSGHHRRFIQFSKSDEVAQMERNIQAYNESIRGKWIDIFLPDEEFNGLRSMPVEDGDGNLPKDIHRSIIDPCLFSSLYRVFNNGSFKQGGRFYGGWWQNIPNDYRRFITIDGVPTVEVDFRNMQIAMLYASVGQDLEMDDAYTLEGIDPVYRPLIKTTTMQLINGEGRIRAPCKASLPPNMTWKELQAAIRDRHKPIDRFFNSGEGIRLQRVDSDIAEDVMLELMDKGIVVLPIHDSFIVPEGHQDHLRTVMLAAYRKHMDGRAVGLKQARTLFDDLLEGKANLSASERCRTGLERFHERKRGEGYIGYRMREEWASGTGLNTKAVPERERNHNGCALPRRMKLTSPRAWIKEYLMRYRS